MVDAVSRHKEAIAALCGAYHVKRLDVFGSAASGTDFDPARSDVDFVVEFEPGTDLGPWLATYHDFKRDLEKLLGRSVDLVMAGASRNPYFIHELEHTRQKIYAS